MKTKISYSHDQYSEVLFTFGVVLCYKHRHKIGSWLKYYWL